MAPGSGLRTKNAPRLLNVGHLASLVSCQARPSSTAYALLATLALGGCRTETSSASAVATSRVPIALSEQPTAFSPARADAATNAEGALPCSLEKNLRSSGSGGPLEVRFTNRTSAETRLFWLDFNGARQPYATLAPGQSTSQPTFAGHAWLAADGYGRCVGLWVPDADHASDLRVTTVLPPPAPLPPSSLPPPPSALGLPPFYTKYLDAVGIPVVSSAKVGDRALSIARDLVIRLLAKRDDARVRIIAAHVRVAVMAPDEQTLDIPEYADLANVPTDTGADWNQRARGLGATLQRPVTSCGEENLLCLPNDRYRGENILIHDFAHTIHEIGIAPGDPGFQRDLESALTKAKAKGLWRGTYAATNPSEYWAEGVQDWFDTNLTGVSQHNEIHTRAQLKAYDPALYALLARVFNDDAWRYQCP